MHFEIAENKKKSQKQAMYYLVWFWICLFLYARIPEKDIISGWVGFKLDFIMAAWGQGKALERILSKSL